MVNNQLQLQFQQTYDQPLHESADIIIDIPPLVKMIKEDAPQVYLNSPEDVFRKFSEETRTYQQEFLMAIYMTIRNKYLGNEVLFLGGMDRASFDPKILFRKLLIRGDTLNFMIIHNHPSGKAAPSDEDLAVTKDVMKISDLLGFNFLDHIIIADKEFYSFRRGYKDLWS